MQAKNSYWYLGVREVIEAIRQNSPRTRIILGGVYATLCAIHAPTLQADLIIEGADLNPLRRFLGLAKDLNHPLDRHPEAEAEKNMPGELSSCAGV
jgi:hypothetical protein